MRLWGLFEDRNQPEFATSQPGRSLQRRNQQALSDCHQELLSTRNGRWYEGELYLERSGKRFRALNVSLASSSPFRPSSSQDHVPKAHLNLFFIFYLLSVRLVVVVQSVRPLLSEPSREVSSFTLSFFDASRFSSLIQLISDYTFLSTIQL